MARIEINGGEHLDIVVNLTVIYTTFFIFVKEDKNQSIVIMLDEGSDINMRVHSFHLFKKENQETL